MAVLLYSVRVSISKSKTVSQRNIMKLDFPEI